MSFSLCTTPSTCCLVTTLEGRTEFNKKYSNRRKCVNLILEFSINNNKDYSWLLDYKFIKCLLVFKYRKVFKLLENLSGAITT